MALYRVRWYYAIEDKCAAKVTVRSRWLNMNNNNNIIKKKDNNDRKSCVGFGVGFGLIGGSIFSTIVLIAGSNFPTIAEMIYEFPLIWALGPSFGMLVGIIIGSIMDLNKIKKV